MSGNNPPGSMWESLQYISLSAVTYISHSLKVNIFVADEIDV
jgi:hypothetical protein